MKRCFTLILTLEMVPAFLLSAAGCGDDGDVGPGAPMALPSAE